MNPRARLVRILLLGAVLAVSAGWWSIGAFATGTGQSFTYLSPPFTQDLYGVSGDLLDPEFGILGGVAFAPNGDVWSSECYFYGTRLHKFDSHGTVSAHSTQLHPETIVDISDLGPYGLSGALPFGAGGCGLVNHPDGYIYSNSSLGIWKLDSTTGLPVDPATNLPIDPNGAPPVGGGLVGGATAQPGNALGIAVDPQTDPNDPAHVHHLVYVGADCHPSLSPTSVTCTLWDLNPSSGVTQVFARLTRPQYAFIDGVYFDPSGQYVFATHRDETTPTPQNSLMIIRRPAALQADSNAAVNDSQLAQAPIHMTSEPDGVAFHAQQGFVVTLNESDDGGALAGTMTRFDFPNGFDQPPTMSEFAHGGFRGDLLQVGGDGCIYATQGGLFETGGTSGARYDDGTTGPENSIVQICGGFAVPPGVQSQTASGSVSGLVYVDTNHNGVHDAIGEPGIGGVTVTLSGGPGGTTVTAADGTYSFTSLPAGQYSVSSPATASGLQLFTASPLTFTLGAAENKSDVDFGYVSGSIAGFAYVDANRNGSRDSGEPGIPNVVITLAGASGATALTAADGSYKFNLIAPGAYTSAAPALAAGKALGTPSPLNVALGLGQDRTGVNFGYVSGGISGFAYIDTNRNFVHDSGEPGIGGVVVTLTGGPGGTTTTAADGSYTFANLDAGTYSVSSPATASGKGLETPSPLSADVIAGQTTPEVSFGYVPGGLSGVVYVDTNRNSVRDTGEPGIGGVVVTLAGGPGGTATTAADGSYSFSSLDAGGYSVSAPSSAGGYGLETPSPLGATVTAGQTTPNVNFGYVPPVPSLSLTKTANATIYSYVGQTIVYTYVIQNTGTVTVSGPFTVTDDKLGPFQCGTATSLNPGASLTCTKSYVIQAKDLGTVTALPTAVGAMVYTGASGVMSTQDTTISGAGPGVH